HGKLKQANLAGFFLARNLAARLNVSPVVAEDLMSTEGINTIDDLPGAVYDFARGQGVNLSPTRRFQRQEGAASLLKAAAQDPKYNFLDLGGAKAFLEGAIETPTEWGDVLGDFWERLDEQAKQHKGEVGGANRRLVDQFTGLDGNGEGSFRELFA